MAQKMLSITIDWVNHKVRKQTTQSDRITRHTCTLPVQCSNKSMFHDNPVSNSRPIGMQYQSR